MTGNKKTGMSVPVFVVKLITKIILFGNNIAVGINPEGVVISQAGVERSKTPAIVAILYMNPERVTE